MRQCEQHRRVLRTDVASEDRSEDHADGHDGKGEVQVVLERPGPRSISPAVGDHESEDPQDEKQQDGIGGVADGGGQSEGPDPPGHRVEGAWNPMAGTDPGTKSAGGHGSADAAATPRHDAGAPHERGHDTGTDKKGYR